MIRRAGASLLSNAVKVLDNCVRRTIITDMTPSTALNATIIGICTATVLSACAVSNAPQRPDAVATGDAFLSAPEAVSVDATSSDWWNGFRDDALAQLVEKALRQNADLRASDAAYLALEAALRQSRLAGRPSTRTTASADISRAPGNGNDTDGSVFGGLAASWEIDAFGRIGALIESAAFDLEAQRQLRRDLAVSVASETALAYIDLRGAQTRLDVAQRNADAQAEGVGLLRTLFENGRATQLDLERAEAQFRTTRASIPVFEADITDAANRLAALVGNASTGSPSALVDLQTSGTIPELSSPLAAGDPAGMLRRRPDIRLAEARIGSRLALGEAARADLFPTITLGADVSALFNEPSDALRSTSLGFGLGPSITWAGPDLRRVRAGIDAADARSQEAIALYEQAVLNALRDAETALSDYSRELERRDDLVAAAQAARRALDIATLRYREGLDDYLDVLDAQRTLLDAEDRLATSQLESARRAVRAYRSLGGVWDDDVLMEFRTNGQDL